MKNKLTLVAQESGLNENKIQTLMSSFGDVYKEAHGLVKEARLIVVKSEGQLEKMQQARELRLSLKGKRVGVEKIRKELKEQSLREGKAIDGMANIIKALIIPVEEYLENQEKFAERKQAEKEIVIENNRIIKLTKYVDDVEIYNLHPQLMSNETFTKLLETSKIAFDAQREAERKVEEERIAKEKAEKEEQERIRIENEKLRKEAEIREKEEAKLKTEQEEKLRVEREKREKVEAKLQEERDAIRKAEEAKIAKKEAEIRAEEEAKRKALLAPDKEKMLELANKVENFTLPNVNSREAGKIIDEVSSKLQQIAEFLRKKAKTL